MTAVSSDPLLPALPITLPAVERSARIPAGFRAAGVPAGIKTSGRPDLALIVADRPASAAAVFTPNRFAAAPVLRSAANLRTTGGSGATAGWATAIVSTSGCANAATGPAGDADQAAVGSAVAAAIGSVDEQVLHLSTGLIGTRLPLDRVRPAIATTVAGGLAATDEALEAAASALRTTDTVTKVASTRVELPAPGGGTVPVTVAGIAKGVGMIHPRMATMLAVLITDAAAEPAALHALLRAATVRTWNQLTVDGDTSTNDTVFLLASGAAGNLPVDGTDAGPAVGAALAPTIDARTALGQAVEAVARDLARQQAADGEGATALITCQVSGADDDAEARAVARAVVASSLVKAAVHGRDPNWGRIAGAAGNATLADAAVLQAAGLPAADAAARSGTAARVDPATLRIAIAGHLVYDGEAGGPAPHDKAAIRAAMAGPEVLLRLDLGRGDGIGEAFGCDLTERYVRENSEYST